MRSPRPSCSTIVETIRGGVVMVIPARLTGSSRTLELRPVGITRLLPDDSDRGAPSLADPGRRPGLCGLALIPPLDMTARYNRMVVSMQATLRRRPRLRRPGRCHAARHRPARAQRPRGRRRAGRALPDELRGGAEARRGPRAGRPRHQGAHRPPQGRAHQHRGAAPGARPARPVRGAVARSHRPHDRPHQPAARRHDA